MKGKIGGILLIICMLGLTACASSKQVNKTESTTIIQESIEETQDDTTQTTEETEFSFEGTTFYYGEDSYDITSRMETVNAILSAVSVGEKIVIECHVGPKNGVYCIFDTVSKSFENDIIGNHLVWHDDDFTTAVYSFWSEIYTYDGQLIKSYELVENEYIYDLTFSSDNKQLQVVIVGNDGTEQTDIVDLQETEFKHITIDLSTAKELHVEGDTVTPLKWNIVSEKKDEKFFFADEWYEERNMSLPMIDEGWNVFHDKLYEYNWVGDHLEIYEKKTGNHLYTLEYPTDKWYINGNNACLKDGIFYGASIMNGYAQPDTCFMFAYDLNNDKLLWRSADQSYNTMNFIVKDDIIICGYGFTDENDYLYQINRYTGEIIDTLPIKKMPDLLVEQDGKLYVHAYDCEYCIEFEYDYEEVLADIYRCDDVYRTDDTPTHGSGTIALPKSQDVWEVKDYQILLCDDGCDPADVVSRASQGYALAYPVFLEGEFDGNYHAYKFKIERNYYSLYLLVLDDSHYAYIELEKKVNDETTEYEEELADCFIKNVKISFNIK